MLELVKPKVRMLTINEAAEQVPGLTKYRIREMCIKGELPHVRAGKKYLICEEVLIRHLTQPTTPPPKEEPLSLIRPPRRIRRTQKQGVRNAYPLPGKEPCPFDKTRTHII